MDCGPWYIAGRPFVIRRWHPGMEMLNIQLTSLSIWVKFYNIPLEYWTNTCLGYIASAVGKPLHLDSPIERRSRLSFARICIEVDLNCEFPKSALLHLGNDKFTTVKIEYPWIPHSCSHCKVYGHKTLHCPISKPINTTSTSYSGGNVGDHGNASGTNVVVGASLQKEFKQVKVPVGNQKDPVKDSIVVDSIIESIIVHPSIISQHSSIKVGAIGGEASFNTFECLTLSEDSTSLDGGEDLASTSYEILDTEEYSDTSPICNTFKLVKRIDELDYSPSQPLSKSKLKRLKKQHRASKLVDGKKVTRSHD